jgi:LPS sulfotransferase NodH
MIASNLLRRDIESSGVHSTYTIAFSVRCGSTVLSNTLANYGLGAPAEYFQYPYGASDYFGAEQSVPNEFFRLVTERVSGGVFGSKMTHDHRAHLDGHLAGTLAGYSSLADVLPNHQWIWLWRRDTVAQAVSWYVAEATNRWHLSTHEDCLPLGRIDYDFFSILAKVMIIGANQANWQAYFDVLGIKPLMLVYEDLVANPSACIAEIFRLLGKEREFPTVRLDVDGGLLPLSERSDMAYRDLKTRFTDDFMKIGQAGDELRLGPSLEKWNSFFFKKGWRLGREVG